MENRIAIVAAKRSPFGKYLGGLSGMDPVRLAVEVATATLTSRGADLTSLVDRLFAGNCFPASFTTASVVGRQIALKLGIGGFATTVDTACCSSLTALRLACNGISARDFGSALVVGVEMLSAVPHLVRGLRAGVRIGEVKMIDPIFPIEYAGYAPVAKDAEYGADRYGVSREEMDKWAHASHQKWQAAQEAGRFADELISIEVAARRKTVTVDRDEQPRPDTPLERLAALPPVFGTSCITAGNAPGLNDGAVAMVIMSEDKAAELGLKPLGYITAQAPAADEPNGITWVPATASAAALEKAGRTIDDVDLIEINEAFSAMPLVSTKVLAGEDDKRWHALLDRTNVNGGAVSIGHPVGASGLRLVAHLAYELKRRGGGTGLAAICGGLSQGEAVIIEAGGGRPEAGG